MHGDDGFGVEVVRRLADRKLPAGVKVAETGIGGIHLVHELMAGYDTVVVVDTVDRGKPPGTLMVIDADVTDVDALGPTERHDALADMHLATPQRALMVARAVGVLPERTIIFGCQPFDVEQLRVGVSERLTPAVDAAVDELESLLGELRGACDSGAPS